VLVLEKRPVVGGNVRSEVDPETGIEIHMYGSHIFHTHIHEVWEFVNRFVKFNGYQHKVLACSRMSCGGKLELEKGRVYHLPLGLTLINKFFGVELKPSEVQAFLDGTFTPTTNIKQPLITDRRSAIFDAFFRGYTSKQWGKAPEDIDPTIVQRVPVRNNYDTNYFDDYWQGVPSEGYNVLFDRLLDHPNIAVRTSCSLKLESKGGGFIVFDEKTNTGAPLYDFPLQLCYSGPIDALFNYKYGALPWRTLRFERETLDTPDYQGTSVVNYPDIDVPYTRIHEFKHYHPELLRGEKGEVVRGWGFGSSKTVIMREYPATWKLGDEPYYPINTPDSAALLAKYQDEVARLNSSLSAHHSSLLVGGRLGQYRYFDMDKSIEAALMVDIA